MPKHVHYLGKNRMQKGQKHPGIYGKRREVSPVPACSYVAARFALPVGYVLALQERYPDRSINLAIKAYLLDNIHPVKDI